ncbi:Serine/threonine-protein kinase PknB [Aquisphaera giovannonii]|uniref:non-specific serine/threonine protein kinase n=1 Tax=Aquisphaera giovannonii TaxID=406548 RepID=A0A5B9WAF8_9BACT|nr:serine/threonine-protein kinase [Aquisphaera giovannonii]QEH37628.1 Serine/threonine-protein kinase PknB [Aquisphaera giovannonii]
MTQPPQSFTPEPAGSGRDETRADVLEDQRRRWRLGERTPVEAYLDRHPHLVDRSEDALCLIYQEVILREQAGQSPQLEEYQRRFPQWATELAVQFEVHRAIESSLVESTVASDRSTASVDGVAMPAGRMVAGCEVLEVLGRGGMGVVYRARQPGLNREVALKMILAGADGSPWASARFRTEAEAVARLQHPNIVQVFQVAEHDGLPCLLLEYAAGGTLAQKLDGIPWAVRRAAETAEVLARAMDYAHARGVVHRDLKPSNVLLAADGTPKVADFGLAKLVQGGESLTRTGDVLGTASYMAPEQAGGPGKVGPTADVYALGVILYEMLTGRPPFRAESTHQTLRQVIAVEPVSPGRLRPGLSRDLETICLKCLEKRPAKRYASAGHLGDDLRRFLDGRPIQARRVGPIGRLVRWSGRHPAVAGLTAALATLVAAAAIGLMLSARNERRLRLQAEGNLDVARQIVDEMYTQVAADVEGRPGMDAYQRRLLERALRFYRSFALRQSGRPEVRHEAAEAGLRAGDITLKLGRVEEAEEAYRGAVEVLEGLAGEAPAEPRYRSTLAGGLDRAGRLAAATSRTDRAEAMLRRAVAMYETLAAGSPNDAGYREGLARARVDLGSVFLQAGRLAEAEEEFRKARDLAEALVREQPEVFRHHAGLGTSYANLGRIAQETGRWGEARSNLERAVDEYGKQARGEPSRADSRFDLAMAVSNVAHLASDTRRMVEARAAYLRAEAIVAGLLKEHPDVSPYRKGLAKLRLNLGEVQRRAGRLDEAVQALRGAVPLWDELVEDEPEVTENRASLALCLNDLGIAYVALGRFDEAEAAYRRAVPLRERLAADHPEQVELNVQLGGIYGNLGQLHSSRRDHRAAIGWFDRASGVLEGVLRAEPRHAEARRYLRNVMSQRGAALDALGRPAEALSAWDRALELQEGLPPDSSASFTCAGRAEALEALGRYPEALAAWDRAIRDAPEPSREDYVSSRALTLARMGDHARATASAAAAFRSPLNAYNAACVYALSCSAVRHMNNAPPGAATISAGYAARAVEILGLVRATGHFNDPAQLRLLLTDGDLDSLRDRPDFRLMIYDLLFPADVFARK